MNEEQTECYRVLGLRPGASSADLKAAHRDLAKVWHPDRFLHDLRLQQKAQEKLKEINEAYDQLTGKTKPRTSPAASQERHATVKVDLGRRIRWQLVVAPVLIFVATFLFVSRSLLRKGGQVEESSIPAIREVQHPQNPEEQQSANRDSSAKASAGREGETKSQPDFNGGSTSEPSAPLRPMTIVTVVIDSSTGMLARPWCPMKTSMTYPSGNQPRAYCTSHPTSPVPPLERTDAGESRIKSAAKRVAAPVKWLDEKTK